MGLADWIEKRRKKSTIEKAQEIIENFGDKIADEDYPNEAVAGEMIKKVEEITELGDSESVAEEDSTKLVTNILQEVDSDEVQKELLSELLKRYPDKAVEVANETIKKNVSIPDEALTEIITSPDTEAREVKNLPLGIDDKDTKKKALEDIALERLKNMYESCKDDESEIEFADKLKQILRESRIRTPQITEMLNRCIARKMAYSQYYHGANLVYALTEVISPLEMLEANITEMAKKEYSVIENEQGANSSKSKGFMESELKREIIGCFASSIANQYAKQSKVASAMLMLPKSKAVQDIGKDPKTEEMFVRELTSKCDSYGAPLEKSEIEFVRSQMHLKDGQRKASVELITMINGLDMEKRNQFSSYLVEILESVQTLPAEEQTGMLEMISRASTQMIEKYKPVLEARASKSQSENFDGDEPGEK